MENNPLFTVKKTLPAAALFFLLGCLAFAPAGAWAGEPGGGAVPAPAAPPLSLSGEPAAPPRFAVIPENARRGEPVTVGYSAGVPEGGGLQAVLLDSRGRRIAKAAFFSLPREKGEEMLRAAIMAVPSTAVAGDAAIRIESGDGIIQDLPFRIGARAFPSEAIDLDARNTGLRTDPDPRKTREARELLAILSRTGTGIYPAGAFSPPVASTRRTSQYGHRRVYRYADGTDASAIHAGVDYGVPTGTEIRACAPGRVVLAKPRIVTGNSVVLEHLPGVYSLYYHLDTTGVSEGQEVEAGEVLGRSGATGLATGPHLHWEIRVSGENADPDAFVSRAVLDKNDIIRKLVSYR